MYRYLLIFEVKLIFEMLTVCGQHHSFRLTIECSCEGVEELETENVKTWGGYIIWYTRILVITATNRNGQNLNGHKSKQPQTGTATNRNGHKPKRPQTRTATDRNVHKPKRPQTGTATNWNGHKPERPQTRTATYRNRHNHIWFSRLQICVLNRSFKLVSRSRQK